MRILTTLLFLGLTMSCTSQEFEDAPKAPQVRTTVKFDYYAQPLPEIPLPNDIATRYDADSPTLRRINASLIAPSSFEREVRALFDGLDGWGIGQPITIPFTGPLDIDSILKGHRDHDYDPSNDVIYLIDITEGSPDEGRLYALDLGEGNFPVTLEKPEYWKNDPRGWTLSLHFEEADEDLDGDGILDPGEDLNGNGVLDPGEDRNENGVLDPPEDTDADGVLDTPNYLPGKSPSRSDLAARSDALMYFYEKETNTLIAQPMVPLRERTTYAVVVTTRLKDARGRAVGSPFEYRYHLSQHEALKNLDNYLPSGLSMSDVAFAFSFTTQTVESDFVAVRDGLYGRGIQKHLSEAYPAKITKMFPLFDADNPDFEGRTSPYLLTGEDFSYAYREIAKLLQEREGTPLRKNLESHSYIDYHVVGQFESPQLFEREDERGNPLGYNSQVWPTDLTTKVAPHRSETITFWLTVPRKEVSARKDGEAVPVVMLSHGYTSSRFGEVAGFAGYFAKHGMATLGIECPSHGLGVTADEIELGRSLLSAAGVAEFADAIMNDRAFDQNNDGKVDSGADFWTAYVFHTRDIVRQCALDHLTLTRLLRSFDGQRKWAFDLNGDGEKELAGDFDGDGKVDIGLDAPINMVGASLGGIMSTILGGLEPHITAIAPIAGGGGLANIGTRSRQGGVREAVILRIMAPVFTGTLQEDGSGLLLETIVPDLNATKILPLGKVADAKPGDTMVVTNIDNGERGCGYISKDGTVRTGIAADIANQANLGRFLQGVRTRLLARNEPAEALDCQAACAMMQACAESTCGTAMMDYTCDVFCADQSEVTVPSCADVQAAVQEDGSVCRELELADRIRIDVYAGPKLVTGSKHCEVVGGAVPMKSLDTFEETITYQEHTFRDGSPLVALAQGNGERRATPGLRRFLSLAQLVLDPADPAVFARHFAQEPLVYGTGEQTQTNAMIVTTLGDMNVPASSGVHAARAAGFVNYRDVVPDNKYDGTPYEGLTANQILIDTYVSEAVDVVGRFFDGDTPVHIDVENFSQTTDLWGDGVPRLEPPIRLIEKTPNGDGISGAIFPMGEPTGQHGFDLPGQQYEKALRVCIEQCADDDGCGCSTAKHYDVGLFMFNVLGKYLSTGGKVWDTDLCHAYDECPDKQPRPTSRFENRVFEDLFVNGGQPTAEENTDNQSDPDGAGAQAGASTSDAPDEGGKEASGGIAGDTGIDEVTDASQGGEPTDIDAAGAAAEEVMTGGADGAGGTGGAAR
ncbi:MAG: hypothetical protein VX589_21155 [Myxococcota bacterium]|nr:hypothetical protein [Myxococcota bacterium]